MSSESLFKDITVLHARLFDHRPIVQGHTNYFVKEFEERRGDRETFRLMKTLDGLNTVSLMLPNLTAVLADCLTDIVQKVSSSTEICTKICDSEIGTPTELLVKHREKRTEDWAEFMEQQVQKSAEVDREFEGQVAAAKEHYAKLEEKILASV
ncbi:biogenesis of lysosome-related organelles complex 1 subunit 5-like [Gigantopelta aegis]|uniref:biogenesis of lysosome-related organelles complex 1 subunit 5-like n=1 Tax=Gigantopelta aegis TaxID=1735272 RepID=UPI001B88BF86|nr:biogenesis of lysosome-related organelles complex 1 subunit 5-like [Gigantopelta aegis]